MNNQNAVPNLNIGDARIMFRNFEGRPDQYNKKGDREFCVKIEDPDEAESLKAEGWNVKVLPARDPDEPDTHYIRVKVNYEGFRPPKIYVIAGGIKTLLTAETVADLDRDEITHVDLTIRPYPWAVNGQEGIAAYLQTMYVTIEEDFWAAQYRNV